MYGHASVRTSAGHLCYSSQTLERINYLLTVTAVDNMEGGTVDGPKTSILLSCDALVMYSVKNWLAYWRVNALPAEWQHARPAGCVLQLWDAFPQHNQPWAKQRRPDQYTCPTLVVSNYR